MQPCSTGWTVFTSAPSPPLRPIGSCCLASAVRLPVKPPLIFFLPRLKWVTIDIQRCLPIAKPLCARHTQVLEAPVVCARWLPWLRASGFFPLIVGFNLQICRLPPFMLQFHKKISIHYNIKNNHRTWKQLIYSHLRLVSSCLVSQVFQQWRWKIPSQHTGVISQLRHLVWNNKNILTGCSLQRSCAISAR